MARSRVRESTSDIAEQIEAAVRRQEQERIEAAVDERAGQMRDFAVSISPEDTGEYKDSFEIDKGTRDGLPTRSLKNTDPIAYLVEYGTIDTPEFAVLQRTAAAFDGTVDH
jgi:hypothetical protein